MSPVRFLEVPLLLSLVPAKDFGPKREFFYCFYIRDAQQKANATTTGIIGFLTVKTEVKQNVRVGEKVRGWLNGIDISRVSRKSYLAYARVG